MPGELVVQGGQGLLGLAYECLRRQCVPAHVHRSRKRGQQLVQRGRPVRRRIGMRYRPGQGRNVHCDRRDRGRMHKDGRVHDGNVRFRPVVIDEEVHAAVCAFTSEFEYPDVCQRHDGAYQHGRVLSPVERNGNDDRV